MKFLGKLYFLLSVLSVLLLAQADDYVGCFSTIGSDKSRGTNMYQTPSKCVEECSDYPYVALKTVMNVTVYLTNLPMKPMLRNVQPVVMVMVTLCVVVKTCLAFIKGMGMHQVLVQAPILLQLHLPALRARCRSRLLRRRLRSLVGLLRQTPTILKQPKLSPLRCHQKMVKWFTKLSPYLLLHPLLPRTPRPPRTPQTLPISLRARRLKWAL